MESETNIEEFSIEDIFCSHYFNKMVDDWTSTFANYFADPMMSKEDFTRKELKMHTIDPGFLLKELMDPTTISDNYIRWPGKLAPESWLFNIQTEKETDEELISELFFNSNFLINEDNKQLAEQIQWAKERWIGKKFQFHQ